MADKTSKSQLQQPQQFQPISKHIPKDGQVILGIMNEMGVVEYDPKTVVQLTEFVYKYGTSVLEEARLLANNYKKKSGHLDVDDVKMALQLTGESSFVIPPDREITLECARAKNGNPLPTVKPHCGLRLPPDRYCLAQPNYVLKVLHRKGQKGGSGTANLSATAAMKFGASSTNKPTINYIKRTSAPMVIKQTVSVPKPITKISSALNPGPVPKIVKPKIQISSQNQNTMQSAVNMTTTIPMDTSLGLPAATEIGLKRKRDDDTELA